MAKLIPFLAKFGLFAQKSDGADTFDLRLTRLSAREERARKQAATFRNQPSRRAAAALS